MTFEEQEILQRLEKPILSFEIISNFLDKTAQNAGFKNNHDLLEKSAWFNRFDDYDDEYANMFHRDD